MGEIRDNREISEVPEKKQTETTVSESKADEKLANMLDDSSKSEIKDLKPNSTYVIDGVRVQTDDNGNIYKENGKFVPNNKYTLNGLEYKTDDKGERYPQSPDGYERPFLRKEVKDEIFNNAPKDKEGRYLDANTGLPIDGTPDIGHKPGHEHKREQQKAYEQGLSISEFNEKMNAPDLYQLEDPHNNRSHQYEDKTPIK